MSVTLKLLFAVVSGLCIAGGQIFAYRFARGVQLPLDGLTVLHYSLTVPSFYGMFLGYGLGFVTYLALLRYFPLAEVSITVLVVTIGAMTAYTHFFAEGLTNVQWLGAVLATIGVIALQSR